MKYVVGTVPATETYGVFDTPEDAMLVVYEMNKHFEKNEVSMCAEVRFITK